jgi:small subunit ribosomal protein S7
VKHGRRRSSDSGAGRSRPHLPRRKPRWSAPKAPVFGKYDTTEIVINDAGLAKYIDLNSTSVPHSGGKHANKWFGKSNLSIVERLINNIMRTEKYTGKKLKAYKAVSDAFDIIAEEDQEEPCTGPRGGPRERSTP